jgi:hypothetical protein
MNAVHQTFRPTRWLFCAPAIAWLALLAGAGTAQTAGVTETRQAQANNAPYTVPTTEQNLLSSANGATLSATPANPAGSEGTGTSWGALTDGTWGDTTKSTAVVVGSQNQPITTTLTYTLNTTASPTGYDITAIDTYGWWVDPGRDDQRYSVYYETVDAPGTFTLLHTVTYNGPAAPSTRVNLAITELVGVSAIRFVFPAQEGDYAGYGPDHDRERRQLRGSGIQRESRLPGVRVWQLPWQRALWQVR